MLYNLSIVVMPTWKQLTKYLSVLKANVVCLANEGRQRLTQSHRIGRGSIHVFTQLTILGDDVNHTRGRSSE